jgi:hypothetical protein
MDHNDGGFSEDEEIAGSSEEPSAMSARPLTGSRPTRRAGRAGRGGARRTAVALAPTVSGSEKASEEAAPNPPIACHLCVQAFTSSDSVKNLKGHKFHEGACFNAVRCYRRLQGHGSKLAQADRQMVDNASEWRDIVAPLSVSGIDNRTGHRNRVKAQVSSLDKSFTRTESTTGMLRLTKRRYKSFVQMWDKVGSESASDEFERLRDENGSEFDGSDGEEMVLVKDNARLEEVRGIEQSRRYKYEKPDALRNAAGGSDSGQGGSRDRRDPGGDRRRDRLAAAEATTLCASGSSGVRSPHTLCSASVSGDDGSRMLGGEPSTLPPCKKPRLTEKTLAALQGGLSPAVGRTAGLSHLGSECGGASIGKKDKISPVEFMQVRSKLKGELQKSIAAVRKRSSVLNMIKLAVSRLTSAQMSLLEKQPSVVVSNIEENIKLLTSIVDELESLRLSGLEAAQTRASLALASLSDVEAEAGEQLQAMNFLITEKTKETKVQGNHTRYMRTKVQTKLVTGSYTKLFAKSVVMRIEANEEGISMNPANFQPKSVQMWNRDSEDGKAFLDRIVTFRTTSAGQEQEKLANLAKCLESKSHWSGCMARLHAAEHDFKDWPFNEKLFGLDTPGSYPWVTSIRPFAWRYGPHAWPMLGMGSFVQNLSDESVDMCFIVLPTASVIQKGISLKDLQAFLDTDSGQTWFKDEGTFVKLPTGPDSALWIPYGHVVVPLAVVDVPSDDKQKKEQANIFGHLWCWTPFAKSFAAEVDSQSWTAIVAWNKEHIEKNKSQAIWADRMSLLSQFLPTVTRAA